jgi:transposase
MISRLQIGADMAKAWFDVDYSVKKQEFAIRYPNTPEGHRKFIEHARGLARKIHVCMEYTGGFETALATACHEVGFIVSLIDGGLFKRYRDTFSKSGLGTDKHSAKLLARYCQERKPERWYPVPDEYRTLRELVRHRQSLLTGKQGWACRSSNTVETELVAAQRKALVAIFTEMTKEVEKAIKAHIKAHPNLAQALKLLVSIPGISFISGSRILAEVGPITNYPTAKALALQAGLAPVVFGSGEKVPVGKLPVYGNKELRCAVYYPTLVAKRFGTGAGPFMLRLAGRGGKVKMTVIAAGMRKMIHLIFGVLSSSTEFDQNKA